MKVLRKLHYPNDRHAVAAVIACAVLLTILVVMWLAVATNTALLSQQLDDNETTLRQLTEEANHLWKQIGDVTSPAQMKHRMQVAGFGPPTEMQYLLVPTATVQVSSTPVTSSKNASATPEERGQP